MIKPREADRSGGCSRGHDQMQEIASGGAVLLGASPSNVAVLIGCQHCRVNSFVGPGRGRGAENARMCSWEKDAQHYVQLWDESKKNYMDYSEETQAIVVQIDDLLNEIRQKEAEAQQLHEAVNNARQQAQSSMEEVVREVEDKCKELENSFFDLQMENLQLKKELEKYKNING